MRIALYESVGFVEYGRNPKGFRSRLTGWQEVVLMRLEQGGQSVDALYLLSYGGKSKPMKYNTVTGR